MTTCHVLKSGTAMAVSILGGAFLSLLAVHWLSNAGGGLASLALLAGASAGFLGWHLSENIGDSVVVLIGTSFPGLVIILYLPGGFMRTLAISLLCGVNAGKLVGGIYREFSGPSP